MCWQQERFGDAAVHLEQALAIAHAVGNSVGEAGAWTNLGRASHRVGRVEDAVRCHERSLTVYRAVGGRFGEAEALWGLGQACHALGHVALARAHWRNSAGILREIGKLTDGEAETLLRQQVPETPAVLLRYT